MIISDGENDVEYLSMLVEYYVSGLCIMVVSVVGVSGNIVSGLIMRARQRDTSQTLRSLLLWLAMLSSLFLVLVVMMFSLPQFSPHYSQYVLPYIVPTVLPATSTVMTGSLYLVMSLCIEKVLTMPGRNMGNKGAFLGYILPTALFSTFYNLPKFFEYSTQFMEEGSAVIPYIHPTTFRQNEDYSFYVLGADLIFLGLVPLTVFLICSILLYLGGGDTNNIVVYTIVIIQIASHAPRTGLNICDIYQSYNNNNNNNNNNTMHHPWLLDISHLLLTISSSVTVIIFIAQEQLCRPKIKGDIHTVLSLYRQDIIDPGETLDREVTNKLMEDNSYKAAVGDS